MNTDYHDQPKAPARVERQQRPHFAARRLGVAVTAAVVLFGGGKAIDGVDNALHYQTVDSATTHVDGNLVNTVENVTDELAREHGVNPDDVRDQVRAAQEVDAELRAQPGSNGEVYVTDHVKVTLEKNALGYKVVADPANIPDISAK